MYNSVKLVGSLCHSAARNAMFSVDYQDQLSGNGRGECSTPGLVPSRQEGTDSRSPLLLSAPATSLQHKHRVQVLGQRLKTQPSSLLDQRLLIAASCTFSHPRHNTR